MFVTGARFRRFREKHVLYCEGGSSESCGPAASNVPKRRSEGLSRTQQRMPVNTTSGEIASSSATHTLTQDLSGNLFITITSIVAFCIAFFHSFVVIM